MTHRLITATLALIITLGLLTAPAANAAPQAGEVNVAAAATYPHRIEYYSGFNYGGTYYRALGLIDGDCNAPGYTDTNPYPYLYNDASSIKLHSDNAAAIRHCNYMTVIAVTGHSISKCLRVGNSGFPSMHPLSTFDNKVRTVKVRYNSTCALLT